MTADVCPTDYFCNQCGSDRKDKKHISLWSGLPCDNQWHDQPAPSEGQKATMAVQGLVKAFDGIGKGRAVNRRKVTDEMVNRFLSWKIPESVCSDLCMTSQGEGRNGTSIMNATEARAMLEHVLADEPAPAQGVTVTGELPIEVIDCRVGTAPTKPAEPVSATPRTNTEMPKVIGYWMDDGFFGEFSAPSSGCIPEHGWRPLMFLGDCAAMVAGLKRELTEAKRLYEMAVKGRQEFRSALREAKERAESDEARAAELQAKLADETARADGAHNAAIDKCYQISIDWDQLTYDEFRDKYSPKFHRSLAILALKVPQ